MQGRLRLKNLGFGFFINGWTMNRLAAALILLPLMLSDFGVCTSQALLSGPPPVLLMQRQGRSLREQSSIAVNAPGEALILWADTALWTNAKASKIIRGIPPSGMRFIFALEDSTWSGVFVKTGKPIFGGMGWHSSYYCVGGTAGSFTDSTSQISEAYSIISGSEPGSVQSANLLDIRAFKHENRLILTTQNRGSAFWAGVPSAFDLSEIWSWESGSDVRQLHRLEYAPFGYKGTDSLQGLLRLSPPINNRCALYTRKELAKNNDRPEHKYQRILSWFEPATGAITGEAILDTAAAESLDLSDDVLISPSGTVDVLRRNLTTGHMFVERYDADRQLLTTIDLPFQPRNVHMQDPYKSPEEAMAEQWFTKADMSWTALGDGSMLVAWSEMHGEDAAIMVALFDSSWNVIGAIKQVHEDTAGLCVYPRLAVQGSSVYLVWQNSRQDVSSLWLRVFSLDNITGIETHSPTPDQFSIDVWPQPASRFVSISVDLPRASFLRVTVHDALGRVVSLLADDFHDAGMHTLQFNAGSLPSGVYFASFLLDRKIHTRKLLLQ